MARSMTLSVLDIPPETREILHAGTVIPAHPLALNADRSLDVRRQRALTRYYLDSGVGGIAVGVHATQFAIRQAGLYAAVLELSAAEVSTWTDRAIVLVAGLTGKTEEATAEAHTAVSLGYHAGLLSLSGHQDASEDELIEHCSAIARIIPTIGFYLQPAVGGIRLRETFWKRFAQIENVVAIKVAPFDRYQTLEVAAGIAAAGGTDRITLYTGNDDHIFLDLLAPLSVTFEDGFEELHIPGGLLGQWSVWTSRAVEMLTNISAARRADNISYDLLRQAAELTECNRAIFDAANGFAGCIPGCHEILRRQGLMAGNWCLDPEEKLSPGQHAAISRVIAAYPRMNDDAFVRCNLERWLEQ